MVLGTFTFGINTAAYDALRRSTEYRWPGQPLFGKDDALQHTGMGPDVITLSGVIMTTYRGGTGQLEILRGIAAKGQPQILVTGLGQVLGKWVVERVEETQSLFASAGMPRMQQFTVQLRKYGNVGI